MFVAISTAFMAAFAALSSLMAGHQSNEALISQMKASDQWAYYNAKGIKAEVADAVTKINFSKAADSSKDVAARKAKLKEDQKKIQEKAEELEKESETHLGKDVILARAVTFFQIAISRFRHIDIIKKKQPWYISLVLFLRQGYSSLLLGCCELTIESGEWPLMQAIKATAQEYPPVFTMQQG